MAPTSAGLTNGGQTTHYQFTYDNSLGGTGGIEPARTNQVLANCEADFNLMSGWFDNIALDVNFTHCRQRDAKQRRGGLELLRPEPDRHHQPRQPATPPSSAICSCRKWSSSSCGPRARAGTEAAPKEARGRASPASSAAQFLAANGLGATPADSPTATRGSRASGPTGSTTSITPTTAPTPSPAARLSSSITSSPSSASRINEIVAAGAKTLGGVYRNLTGDTADPFPFFKQLVRHGLPRHLHDHHRATSTTRSRSASSPSGSTRAPSAATR